MANETSKAMRRRMKEDADGKFPWRKIFKGKGIDVGPGPDPLKMSDCIGFDLDQGNANNLSQYFGANTFNYLHASQCLEHMDDPEHALREWISVVKPKGHLVITVPCMELYGDILWGKDGSRYNLDHKSTWSPGLKRSGAPIHIYVPDFCKFIGRKLKSKVIMNRVVDTNYDYTVGFSVDQTFPFENGVEAWIELVIKKT